MSVEFEWRFDEELPDSPPRGERSPRRPRWRIWLGLGGAVLLLAGIGLYGWWRVRSAALAQVEAQVQTVAQLELRALAEGDTELYLSLQDDADPNWQETQEARATLDAALPPPLPGLISTTALSVENARVVGDRARVEVRRLAGLPGGEMAPFRAVRFYRRTDDGRWLHTRADLGYAGHTITWVGERVKIKSFAADEEWIEPIVPQLEGLAERFCILVPCRWDTPLMLDFTGTPDTAVEWAHILPAPFLVGAPEDEAARATWEAALRELLFDRLIAREVGQFAVALEQGALLIVPLDDETTRVVIEEMAWERNSGALFRARLREWLRAELGLSEPISPDLNLVGEALDAGKWIPLEALWFFTPTDDTSPLEGGPRGDRQPLAEAEIDLLLAFIEKEYGRSTVAGLLHALHKAPWIEPLLWEGLHGRWPDFESRYIAYVREVSGRSARLPGRVAAFAEYDLVAACETPSSLWGLRLDRLEMTPLSSAAGFDFLSWSPDGARLLARRSTIYGGGLYLLEADGAGVRRLTSVPEGAWPIGWSPDGSRVAYSTSARSPEGGLVDVEADESVVLNGSSFAWSPDGSQLAYVTMSEYTPPLVWLAEGDGSNPRQVGEGYSMAWSPDGTQIAFFSAESALKIYDVTTGETRRLVDSNMLYDLFDFGGERGSVSADSLVWSPIGEGIGFGVNQFGRMKLMNGGIALIRPDGSDLHILFTREAGVAVTGRSPDGRWLTSILYDRYDRAPFITTVVGIDGTVLLEANAVVSWSPDGRYLAVARMDRLRLLEVESEVWYSFEPAAYCRSVVWNPRGPLHEPIPSSRDAAPP